MAIAVLWLTSSAETPYSRHTSYSSQGPKKKFGRVIKVSRQEIIRTTRPEEDSSADSKRSIDWIIQKLKLSKDRFCTSTENRKSASCRIDI